MAQRGRGAKQGTIGSTIGDSSESIGYSSESPHTHKAAAADPWTSDPSRPPGMTSCQLGPWPGGDALGARCSTRGSMPRHKGLAASLALSPPRPKGPERAWPAQRSRLGLGPGLPGPEPRSRGEGKGLRDQCGLKRPPHAIRRCEWRRRRRRGLHDCHAGLEAVNRSNRLHRLLGSGLEA